MFSIPNPNNKKSQKDKQETARRAFNLTDAELAAVKKIETECGLSPWSADDYKTEAESKNSIFLIAEDGQRIVGFLNARLTKDFDADVLAEKPENPFGAEATEADLLNFGVSEEFRRKGIGGALFGKLLAIAAAAAVRNLWLEVRKSNAAAIEFYTRRNFQVVQIRKRFYSAPVEDALLMRLSFSGRAAAGDFPKASGGNVRAT